MLLYGRNSVFERLRVNPLTVRRIYLQDNLSLPDNVGKLIKTNNIRLEIVSAKRLQKIKPAKTLQGIAAEVNGFQYASFDDLLVGDKNKALSVLFLDRINDPQNLGAIIRTAACFGNFAVAIPRHDACGVTEAALHVACGGENYVAVAMVNNLSKAIIRAKENGWWIAGADLGEDAQPLDVTRLPFPLGMVLGFEGEGLRKGVCKHLDMRIRIPMKGAKLSFNVAVACAILCYEITKQRNK